MINDATSYILLKTLEDNRDLSQRDMAKCLGVSLGKVNFCLKALISKGCLKVGNFRNSDDQRAYAYLITPHVVEQKARVTVEFMQIKIHEDERLSMEIAELKLEAKQNGR